jgi:hypothetical protein
MLTGKVYSFVLLKKESLDRSHTLHYASSVLGANNSESFTIFIMNIPGSDDGSGVPGYELKF